MSEREGILFTAFEPSGDALAAPLIAALRQREPKRPIYAMGGEKMQAAGAELIEHTTGRAVMLSGSVKQALTHRARVRRLRAWMGEHRLAAVVPTDSPAANWSICALTRRVQPEAKIVHLAAPQLWAWGRWRIGKLRRLTDGVLCLLPFEPEWFERRGVPATFVGHPLFEDEARSPTSDGPSDLPKGASLRVAILPGSRNAEIVANWPAMLAAAQAMGKDDRPVHVAVCAADEPRAKLIRSHCAGGKLPAGFSLWVARTPAVLDWADVALVVSGTATLQCAAKRIPMVVVYRVNWWSWHVAGRWLVNTRTFTLPNLIARGLGRAAVVPELIPFFGDWKQVQQAVETLVDNAAAQASQRETFDAIIAVFKQQTFSETAANALLKIVSTDDAGG